MRLALSLLVLFMVSDVIYCIYEAAAIIPVGQRCHLRHLSDVQSDVHSDYLIAGEVVTSPCHRLE